MGVELGEQGTAMSVEAIVNETCEKYLLTYGFSDNTNEVMD